MALCQGYYPAERPAERGGDGAHDHIIITNLSAANNCHRPLRYSQRELSEHRLRATAGNRSVLTPSTLKVYPFKYSADIFKES